MQNICLPVVWCLAKQQHMKKAAEAIYVCLPVWWNFQSIPKRSNAQDYTIGCTERRSRSEKSLPRRSLSHTRLACSCCMQRMSPRDALLYHCIPRLESPRLRMCLHTPCKLSGWFLSLKWSFRHIQLQQHRMECKCCLRWDLRNNMN